MKHVLAVVVLVAAALGVVQSQSVTQTATLHSAKVTVTSAELDNLSSTPITVIPNSNSDKVVYPVGVFVTYNIGTDGYTYTGGNGNLILSWGNNGNGNQGQYQFPALILQGAAPSMSQNLIPFPFQVLPTPSSIADILVPANPGPFTLQTDGGVLSGGNGTLTVSAVYYTDTVSAN